MHTDKHVVKMVLETAQILSTTQPDHPMAYKLTHVNHPACVWTRHCPANTLWTWRMGMSLCREYTHRYGKKHKSQSVIEALYPEQAHGRSTQQARCYPMSYDLPTVVQGYRRYYLLEKLDNATYTNRKPPVWARHVVLPDGPNKWRNPYMKQFIESFKEAKAIGQKPDHWEANEDTRRALTRIYLNRLSVIPKLLACGKPINTNPRLPDNRIVLKSKKDTILTFDWDPQRD